MPDNPLSLGPEVQVNPAQVRRAEHVPEPQAIDNESDFSINHLWRDDSEVSQTLLEAQRLSHLCRNFRGDPAWRPIKFKLSKWLVILRMIDRERVARHCTDTDVLELEYTIHQVEIALGIYNKGT